MLKNNPVVTCLKTHELLREKKKGAPGAPFCFTFFVLVVLQAE